MKEWLRKIEFFVDRFIPCLLVLLIIVIVIDFFYHEIAEKYKFEIGLIDGFIVVVFVLDLFFKFRRSVSIPNFLKRYWLEILAVFPFYLIFRVIETTVGFLEVSGLIKQGQNILHSSVEVEKEFALIVREAEEIEKVGARTRAFSKTLRVISRAPRLVAAASFYEDPKVINNQKKLFKKISSKTKKEIKNVSRFTKKELKKFEKKIKRT